MILLIGIYAPRRPFSNLWSHGAESLLGDVFPRRAPLAQTSVLQFMCDNASVKLQSLSIFPCELMAQGTQHIGHGGGWWGGDVKMHFERSPGGG